MSGKAKSQWPTNRGRRGYIGVLLGLYRDNGKENGNYYNWLSWGYIEIMEKKLETTIIMGYIGVRTLNPKP